MRPRNNGLQTGREPLARRVVGPTERPLLPAWFYRPVPLEHPPNERGRDRLRNTLLLAGTALQAYLRWKYG